jgi:hypothetical protein
MWPKSTNSIFKKVFSQSLRQTMGHAIGITPSLFKTGFKNHLSHKKELTSLYYKEIDLNDYE